VQLDVDAARAALATLGDPFDVAREALAVAEANMAEELRAAIVARGHARLRGGFRRLLGR